MPIWVCRMIELRKLLILLSVLMMPAMAAATVDETSDKSLFFAGRCMAPVLLGKDVFIDGLGEMPHTQGAAHLYGAPGQVYYGESETVLLIRHKNTSCGVNVFDETFEDVTSFLTHWLERPESPFTLTENVELDDGNRRVAYDGHCTECGFDVHARALWFKDANFTIYRLFATKPETE